MSKEMKTYDKVIQAIIRDRQAAAHEAKKARQQRAADQKAAEDAILRPLLDVLRDVKKSDLAAKLYIHDRSWSTRDKYYAADPREFRITLRPTEVVITARGPFNSTEDEEVASAPSGQAHTLIPLMLGLIADGARHRDV